jgi:hypothetical protein
VSGFWMFASVVAFFVWFTFMLLLKVRMDDVRADRKADRIAREIEQERVSKEAMTVISNNTTLERERLLYATKQAEFGMKCLEAAQRGLWGSDLDDLKAACIRQLDGVAPPLGQKTVIRATMPDLSGREMPPEVRNW